MREGVCNVCVCSCTDTPTQPSTTERLWLVREARLVHPTVKESPKEINKGLAGKNLNSRAVSSPVYSRSSPRARPPPRSDRGPSARRPASPRRPAGTWAPEQLKVVQTSAQRGRLWPPEAPAVYGLSTPREWPEAGGQGPLRIQSTQSCWKPAFVCPPVRTLPHPGLWGADLCQGPQGPQCVHPPPAHCVRAGITEVLACTSQGLQITTLKTKGKWLVEVR